MNRLLGELYKIHDKLIETNSKEEMARWDNKAGFMRMFPMAPFKMIKLYKSGNVETFDGLRLLFSFVSSMITMPNEFKKMERISSIFYNYFGRLKQIKEETGKYPPICATKDSIVFDTTEAELDSYVNVHGDLRESFLILMTSVCFYPFENEEDRDSNYSYLGFKILWTDPAAGIWYDAYSLITMTDPLDKEEEGAPEFLHLSYLNGTRSDQYIFDVKNKVVSSTDIDIVKVIASFTDYQQRIDKIFSRRINKG